MPESTDRTARVKSSKKVDFFIIGEPKSGTTALANFLGEHPDIGFSRPKEPDYFATDVRAEADAFHHGKHPYFIIRTPEQYQACFADCEDKRFWGEGSTLYASSAAAPKNIYDYNPAAKVIIMLRNPVDFLHALHMQMVNIGTENEPDFAKALAKEPARKQGKALAGSTRCPSDLFYDERAHYSEHLERYRAVFPKDQILVLLAEEFQQDNAAVYTQVVKFIGADDGFRPAEFGRFNDARAPRSLLLHRTLNNVALKSAVLKVAGPDRYERFKQTGAKLLLRDKSRTPLDGTVRAELMQRYRSEVLVVSRLLGRPDLPALWGYEA